MVIGGITAMLFMNIFFFVFQSDDGVQWNKMLHPGKRIGLSALSFLLCMVVLWNSGCCLQNDWICCGAAGIFCAMAVFCAYTDYCDQSVYVAAVFMAYVPLFFLNLFQSEAPTALVSLFLVITGIFCSDRYIGSGDIHYIAAVAVCFALLDRPAERFMYFMLSGCCLFLPYRLFIRKKEAQKAFVPAMTCGIAVSGMVMNFI